ncbi:sensor histidine kinase [Aeromicrobium piscarium]|uniref:histidine kinase n=1 Tax=Aeromicrobium piscarium TaxID=2590901 RepID=A0A554S917_9ACTN|nr:sensor domain-containing protein [Aeromicrobium piscarium]TSD62840.1 sensor histidine kinase [Aeromicrobium piscarium]
MAETVTPPTTAPTTLAPPRGARRVLLETAYGLSAIVLGIVALVLVLSLTALGLALIVVVGGVLVLALAAIVARGFAAAERQRLRSMLGREAPTPRYLRSRPDDGLWRRCLTPLRDPQTWLDIVWGVIGWITGTFAFALTVVWWVGALGGLTYWFWQRWIPVDDEGTGLAELLGLGEGRAAESWLNLVLGVLFLVTLPLAVRAGALLHASLAAVLLCSRAELQGEVARAEDGRAAARDAEAESLRRLERDIHDGPQQRLVRLTMDLGRAKRQVSEDPELAAQRIDDALMQARETVAELRSLSRGIAPPLLVDRGLSAAVRELAVQSIVPVTVTTRAVDGLAPHVETAAYFVVAEALANVGKHSGASSASVTVAADGDDLLVRVEDDGIGGAHPAKGLGLAGLRQRLAAVDGALEVSSPEGGPTAVVARIPVDRR